MVDQESVIATPVVQRRPGLVLGSFLYMWLVVGFFTGTAVLVGPVRWILGSVQAAHWNQSSQNHLLVLVILMYVLASFFLARSLVRSTYRTQRREVRVAIPAGATLLALAAAWAWSNPAALLAPMAGSHAEALSFASGAQFLFGPYPDEHKLAELKREGITTIISLQHPSLPVERPGIARERQATAELGLKFVQAPMLPWVSSNEASIEKIQAIARSARGKFYVHCGLGRDRVNLARRAIQLAGGSIAASNAAGHALTLADRKLQAQRGEIRNVAFERGNIVELQPGIWLIPHPNAHELQGYLLSGQVAKVISTLDPAQPEQAAWLREEQQQFGEFRVPVEYVPLHDGDVAAARHIVSLLGAAPRPVVVIVPRTSPVDARKSGGVAGTFLKAWERARTRGQWAMQ